MTLVQLRHFVVLAEVGTFVQAAAALFLTQPALTRSIHALEEELGGALFDRLGRRISLTPFGDEVLVRARRLVSDAEALKQAGQGLHAGLIGQLRVGLSSAPGALLSTPLMLHMAEHHPRLQLQISRGNTAVLLHALREQQLDAAIVDIRDMRPSAELKVSLAFELSAGFLVRPNHPLAQRGGPVGLEDVMAYPVASTPLSDEVARMLIARYGPQANPDDMVTLRCDETMSIVDVARRSNAIVLTVNAAAVDLIRLEVSPSLDATARFGLVTSAKRQEAPALRILRSQLPCWTAALTCAP
ncbi:bacterial regulatory helix-turn-helix, lysR family protein [Hydrogenophaga sp. RAC07]|uniref:LysR substrate-binding domain-containing protein n=1 Tax=Hydrogenophaga sp. RAC07 TaxID=1842537 RepID=UPI00083E2948|nr:LysR family transcriptional regulator [Hydrogenophaga sp. RAC07]AOF85838.1 bacterial regulatory helix-turn-helix, lysR family protein [Hydrogenophaga sp. RAC07]